MLGSGPRAQPLVVQEIGLHQGAVKIHQLPMEVKNVRAKTIKMKPVT